MCVVMSDRRRGITRRIAISTGPLCETMKTFASSGMVLSFPRSKSLSFLVLDGSHQSRPGTTHCFSGVAVRCTCDGLFGISAQYIVPRRAKARDAVVVVETRDGDTMKLGASAVTAVQSALTSRQGPGMSPSGAGALLPWLGGLAGEACFDVSCSFSFTDNSAALAGVVSLTTYYYYVPLDPTASNTCCTRQVRRYSIDSDERSSLGAGLLDPECWD